MAPEIIQLKVCGMREAQNIAEVSALRPDYMGFIFFRESPRYVGDTFGIADNFPETTKRVGVFVNETNKAILEKVKKYALDFVQLHGHESVQQCAALEDQQVRVIKVFSVDDDMDFQITKPYEKKVSYFLFDTKGKFHGGNSQTFNWDILSRYDQSIPFFLSGGISNENISAIRALKKMNLKAIDVNSGVEIEPALKDVKKIMAIKAMLNSKY
jgi:phosphoribosylanthranilate isomerase